MLPLLTCSTEVITLLCQLQSFSVEKFNLPTQKRMLEALDIFVVKARQAYLGESKIKQADYLLCTALDEAYYYACAVPMDTHLLTLRHQDTKGGERFFDNLSTYLNYPEDNHDLLQLCFICLATGFKGKYALQEKGIEILLNKRGQILAAIKQVPSILMAKASDVPVRVKKSWQLRYIAILSVLAISLGYVGFTLLLNQQFKQVQGVANEIVLLQQSPSMRGESR